MTDFDRARLGRLRQVREEALQDPALDDVTRQAIVSELDSEIEGAMPSGAQDFLRQSVGAGAPGLGRLGSSVLRNLEAMSGLGGRFTAPVTDAISKARRYTDYETGAPETAGGTAGAIAGTLAGEGASLLATGAAGKAAVAAGAARSSRAAGVLKKAHDAMKAGGAGGFMARRAAETAFATPYNLLQATDRDFSLAGVGEDLTGLDLPDESFLGRAAFETGADLAIGSVVGGVGEMVQRARAAAKGAEPPPSAVRDLDDTARLAIDSDPTKEWIRVSDEDVASMVADELGVPVQDRFRTPEGFAVALPKGQASEFSRRIDELGLDARPESYFGPTLEDAVGRPEAPQATPGQALAEIEPQEPGTGVSGASVPPKSLEPGEVPGLEAMDAELDRARLGKELAEADLAPDVRQPGGATGKGVDEVGGLATAYVRNRKPEIAGDYREAMDYEPVPEDAAREIADLYESMPHRPDDPEVVASYEALKQETKEQFDFLVENGVEFRPWTQEGQPYATSDEMIADVRDNKRLFFFTGTDEGAATPLLEAAGVTLDGVDLSYNDLFRAVHDYFGHAGEGFQFGPRGEHNAWRKHLAMFTPAARPAMSFETRGQNSWVNYGKHIRREDGSIPKRGDPDFIHPADRPYAEQKAGILPEQYTRGAAMTELVQSLGLASGGGLAAGGAAGAAEGDVEKKAEAALMAGIGTFGLLLAGIPAVKALDESGHLLLPRDVDGRTPMKEKFPNAVWGFDDPEAFGAVLLHRYPDLDAKQFAEKIGARFDDPVQKAGKNLDLSTEEGMADLYEASKKHYASRLAEVLDPEGNPMPLWDELLEVMQKGEPFGVDKWYTGVRPAVAKILGDENADVFIRLLAVTSAGAEATTSNIAFAVKAFIQRQLGMPYTPTPKTTAKQIENAVEATDGVLGDRKINSYGTALGHRSRRARSDEVVVNDLWIHRLFGWGVINKDGKLLNAVTGPQYRFAEQAIRTIADERGMAPRDVQAQLWGGIKAIWEREGTDRFATKEMAERFPGAEEGQRYYRAPGTGAPVLEPYRKTLTRVLDNEGMRGIASGQPTYEDIEQAVRTVIKSKKAQEDMLSSVRAAMAAEVVGNRGGYMHPELAKELLRAGAGAVAGQVVAPEDQDAVGAAVGVLLGTKSGRAGLRTLSSRAGEYSKVSVPAAQAAGSALAAMKGASEEDEQRARGWYWLAAASGAVAMREVPALRAIERAGTETAWNRAILPSVDALKSMAWETDPRLGQFFFSGHRLGGAYQEAKAAMRRSQAEGRLVAKDLVEKIQQYGADADRILSEAADVRDMDYDDLVAQMRAAGVEDPDGAAGVLAEIHGLFATLGEQLVDLELMSRGAFERWEGRYLPRLYEEGTERLASRSDAPRLTGQERLKFRQDNPVDGKVALKSAAVRGATGAVQESHLAAVETFFQTVGANPDWAHTAAYEAGRKLRAANHASRVAGDDESLARKALVDAQEARKELAAAAADAEAKGFVQMAEAKNLGSLSGAWVHPDVKLDLEGFVKLGDTTGKIADYYLKGLRAWKVGKTVLNPGTHARNIISAQILSWMGDGPVPFGSSWQQAMHEVRAGKGPTYALARKHGLLDGTHFDGEIAAMRREAGDQAAAVGLAAGAEAAKGVVGKGLNAAVKLYRDEDLGVRLADFKDAIERRGLPPEEAAELAKSWVPTYENLSGFTQAMSRSVAPFFAYTSQALPRVFESMVRHPVRFLAIGAAIHGLSKILHGDEGIPEEILPPEMRGPMGRFGDGQGPIEGPVDEAAKNLFPTYVPTGKSDDGRESYLDLTYVMPAGDLSEGRTRGRGMFEKLPGFMNPMGNPVFGPAAELALNRDSFTGRDVVALSDTGGEAMKKRVGHLAREWLPSMTPGVGYGWQKMADAITGTPNYVGDVRDVDSAARDVFMGLKTRQLTPETEYTRRAREIQREVRDIQTQIRSVVRDQSISETEKASYQAMKLEQVRRLMTRLERLNEAHGEAR